MKKKKGIFLNNHYYKDYLNIFEKKNMTYVGEAINFLNFKLFYVNCTLMSDWKMTPRLNKLLKEFSMVNNDQILLHKEEELEKKFKYLIKKKSNNCLTILISKFDRNEFNYDILSKIRSKCNIFKGNKIIKFFCYDYRLYI